MFCLYNRQGQAPSWHIRTPVSYTHLYRTRHLSIDSSRAMDAAYNLAKESIVLLKNKSLPIKRRTKVSLLGKYATEKHVLGPWSWHGDPKDTDELAEHINAGYLNSSEYFDDYDIESIEKTDHIILAIGELYHESGEAHSKADVNLSNHYIELLEDLRKLKIPITVILYTGRDVYKRQNIYCVMC